LSGEIDGFNFPRLNPSAKERKIEAITTHHPADYPVTAIWYPVVLFLVVGQWGLFGQLVYGGWGWGHVFEWGEL